MPELNDDWDEPEKHVLQEALRLGFEVGFRGQIEEIGWVRLRYHELEAEASRLDIIENLVEKYEAGKEFGKKKRLSSLVSPDGGLVFQKVPTRPTPFQRKPTPVRQITRESSTDIVCQRVLVADAIDVIANIMILSQKSEKLRERLETIFSSLADLHDRLAYLMQVEGDHARTLSNGLQMLADLGWIENYEVTEINLDARTANVEAVSKIAKEIGQASDPACKLLCIALETIGAKTFNVPMSVVETKCICQNEEKCKFIFVPRLHSV